VFHLAALKHVPVCENQPQEAIKTNIAGTTNLVNAAVRYRVRKFVDVSSDKACLDYFQTITLSDGSKRKIHEIVNNKEVALVKSWDGIKFVDKKIIGWYKNKLNNRLLYRIRYQDAPSFGRKQSSLIVTEDHPLLTPSGWVKASDLIDGDVIYTDEVLLNKKQRALVLGCVLGDATLVKRNKKYNRAYLKIAQCKKQSEWVSIKREAIGSIANDIHIYKGKNEKHQDSVTFCTDSNLYLSELYDLCYNDGGIKHIPRGVLKKCLYDNDIIGIFLASLFMDDGCSTDNLIRIATHGFTKEDIDWFSNELNILGFTSYTYGCTLGYKTYPELRFNAEGTKKLTELISKYVPETMRYKLPSKYINSPYDPLSWDMGDSIYLKAKITVVPYKYKTTRDVYCIDVEDTHNFVARGLVVHNCSPTNLYGFTKAVGEKIVTQANNLSDFTNFVCIRGGNVLGSNGSVVPLFIDQIKRFNRITLTSGKMTRFFLTLSEAIKLLFKATEQSIGGETYVMNMPSFYISDLAQVMIKHFGNSSTSITEIGLREGEKMHEVLISEHEAGRSYIFNGDYYVIAPELKICRDYGHLEGLEKVKFETFSSSDNIKDQDYLEKLLYRGGFLS
jgi:nucleoside-diphosphate-sugar epimerase